MGSLALEFPVNMRWTAVPRIRRSNKRSIVPTSRELVALTSNTVVPKGNMLSSISISVPIDPLDCGTRQPNVERRRSYCPSSDENETLVVAGERTPAENSSLSTLMISDSCVGRLIGSACPVRGITIELFASNPTM